MCTESGVNPIEPCHRLWRSAYPSGTPLPHPKVIFVRDDSTQNLVHLGPRIRQPSIGPLRLTVLSPWTQPPLVKLEAAQLVEEFCVERASTHQKGSWAPHVENAFLLHERLQVSLCFTKFWPLLKDVLCCMWLHGWMKWDNQWSSASIVSKF